MTIKDILSGQTRADALKIYGYAHVWIKRVLQSDYKRVACVKKTWQVL